MSNEGKIQCPECGGWYVNLNSHRRAIHTSVIVAQPKLATSVVKSLQQPTPPDFIKTRKGKGNQEFTYVEGGYVLARLNEAFTPLGWEFEVVEQGILDHEVWVRGKLVVKDFKTGFTISKSQYGSLERRAKMPLGDALKGAATDALKKCASSFGIALDIYWKHEAGDAPQDKPKGKQPKVDYFAKAQAYIKNCKMPSTLMEWRNKPVNRENDWYNEEQRKQLIAQIDEKLNDIPPA